MVGMSSWTDLVSRRAVLQSLAMRGCAGGGLKWALPQMRAVRVHVVGCLMCIAAHQAAACILDLVCLLAAERCLVNLASCHIGLFASLDAATAQRCPGVVQQRRM